VSSDDDRDAYIRALRAEGWTAVEIAEEVGLSRSQVHRILVVVGDPARERPDEDDEDAWVLGENEAELAAPEDPEPVPPWTYVGMDETGPEPEPRFIDARNRPVDSLARYRYGQHLRELGDCEGARRLDADTGAQIAADGWRCTEVGWRTVEEVERLGLLPPMAELLRYDGTGPPPMQRPEFWEAVARQRERRHA